MHGKRPWCLQQGCGVPCPRLCKLVTSPRGRTFLKAQKPGYMYIHAGCTYLYTPTTMCQRCAYLVPCPSCMERKVWSQFLNFEKRLFIFADLNPFFSEAVSLSWLVVLLSSSPPPFFFWQWKVLNFLLRTPPLGRVAHTRYLGLVTVIYIFSFNSASSRVVFILKGGGGDKEAWESVASLLDWFPSVCGGCPLCEACVFPYPIVVTIKKGSVCLGILAVLCQQLDLAIG